MPAIIDILKTDHVEHVAELAEVLVRADGVRLERIVSHGQASPEGFWYDQADDEWVMVVSGQAGLLIEGEGSERVLAPGSCIYLPAGCRHRVAWTDPNGATIWLALFIDPALKPMPAGT